MRSLDVIEPALSTVVKMFPLSWPVLPRMPKPTAGSARALWEIFTLDFQFFMVLFTLFCVHFHKKWS